MHPNRIAEEAIGAGAISELTGYAGLRREVSYGEASRVDFLLQGDDRADCYVEVKAVTLRHDRAACFPDAVTERGSRHLAELAARVRSGDRAVMLFLVMRQDCLEFRPAGWIDPAYAAGLRRARAEGVETLCYACQINVSEMTIGAALPIVLDE
jgi:sugar fermentation stimulation protein A